jgi:hypothetical protein
MGLIFISGARCWACRRSFSVGPGVFGVRRAPRAMACDGCGESNAAGFRFRATWTMNLIWKLLFPLTLPVAAYVLYRLAADGSVSIGWKSIGAALIACAVVSLIPATVIALPTMWIWDAVAEAGQTGRPGH